jgi:phosphohistidine swiveling domain-containing protein
MARKESLLSCRLMDHEIIVDNKRWDLYITRNMPFWHDYPYIEGNYHHMGDFGITSPLEILFVCVGGTQTHFFVNSENQTAFKNAVLEAVKSKEGVDALKQKYEQMAARVLTALEVCLGEISSRNWNSFMQALTPFYAGLNITVSIGRNGHEQLTKQLQELGYGEDKLPSIVSTVTYPSEHTPLFTSELMMLEIGREVQKKHLTPEEIKQRLTVWLEQNGYIPVNFCNEPWVLADVEKQLTATLVKDCAQELELLEKSHQGKVQEAKELLASINNEEVSILAHAIQEGTYLNEFRKNVFSKVSWKVHTIFEEVAKRNGGQWRDCFFLKPEEISKGLNGELGDLASIVASRDTVGFHTNASGETTALPSAEIAKIKNYVTSLHGQGDQFVEQVRTLKGFSASKGKVTGRVKLILSVKDFPRFESGDILVTTMTSVDFVPIMGKAGAFVTNEGGITSHASIVAREMNKPCIIGTKVATQVLKEDDLVEVDANKGVVTILK